MNEDKKFFIEQIYLKLGKRPSHYKFIGIMKKKKEIFTLEKNDPFYIKLLTSWANSAIEQSLNTKIKRLFVHEIIERLKKKNGSYIDNQIIEIKYSDKSFTSMTTTDKQLFYNTLNELVETGYLTKYKRSEYFVSPYYVNNMTEPQWEELRNDFNNLWLSNQNIIGNEKAIE